MYSELKENVLGNYNLCKMIFDNTVNVMMIIGTNGDIISVNRRFEDIFFLF